MKYTLFFLLLFTATVYGQQDLLTTQYWNSYVHLNPATSGLFNDHEGMVMYRNQWDKVNGAPVSFLANYNTRLGHKHHGLGITYSHDRIGFSAFNEANVNYNYQFFFGHRRGQIRRLSVGVSVGLFHFKVDPDWIPSALEDPKFPPGFEGYAPNFNAGVAYTDGRIFGGIGVTHITESRIGSGFMVYNTARQYYGMMAYEFKLGRRKAFGIKPQVLLRTDAIKFSADINLKLSYQTQPVLYWIASSYRTRDAVAFLAGLEINLNRKANERYFFPSRRALNVGYAYDMTINKLAGISRGSHEIVLSFYLNKKVRRPHPPFRPDF